MYCKLLNVVCVLQNSYFDYSETVFVPLSLFTVPCVVSVMAAAAADFPGLPKPSTVANLSQHTSALPSRCKMENHGSIIWETGGEI